MKHNIPQLLAAAGLVATASAKIQAEVRYSDTMVDVGNIDVFAATWQKIYGTAGNQRSILADVTSSGYNGACNSWADGFNLNVNTHIDGQWGQIPGLGPNDSREALTKSIWAALQEIMKLNERNVFSMCYGFTWQEGKPSWCYAGGEGGACGCNKNSVQTDCSCPDAENVSCKDKTVGHKVPSSIKANLYQDGALLADSIEITFSAQDTTAGGCSVAERIAGALAGLVPGAGSIFSAGVTIDCALKM
jgi:hypothetical protein